MSGMEYLRQGGTPFDGFLYAEVGADQGGTPVSVLSLLARLGVDPWQEAAALSDLSRAAAQARLRALLAHVGDVPTLAGNPGPVIARLVDLLPGSAGPVPARQKGDGATTLQTQDVTAFLRAWAGPILAGAIIVLFLLRRFIFGAGGAGD